MMATDLTMYLDDEPGELARLGQVLGDAGVNIEGFCAVTSGGGQSEVHVLVEDVAAADRPGELGQMSRKLGDAGVNIRLAYLATGTRLVFAADDFARAKAALD